MLKFNGPLIRDLRLRKGLALHALATRCGLAERTLRAIENSETAIPQPSTVQALAVALGVPSEGLFEDGPAPDAAPPARPARAHLGSVVIRLRDGTLAGRRAIHAEPFTVGRSDQNAVVLSDPSVSLHHAAFSVRPPALRVRDLGSTNGTWIRGCKIEGSMPIELGEAVGIGSYVVELHGPGTGIDELPEPATVRTRPTPGPR